MTNDQAEIIRWAQSVGGYFTTAEAVEQFGGKYYNHPEKYVGDRLSRLVEAGHLKREMKGRYRVVTPKKAAQVETSQTELF